MPDLGVCLIHASLSRFLKMGVCDNFSLWPGALHHKKCVHENTAKNFQKLMNFAVSDIRVSCV